ncbi:MAG: hypothetical protein AKCLJLPJ_01198 [Fimbriimonadales bacterium]|nr:hypothetical protein [Fimbriimonadales bacterium]
MERERSSCSLDAVLFASPRPEALAEFYERGFGLAPPKWHGTDHLGLNLPNTYLGFDRVEESSTAASAAVSVWFRVPDVEETFARLVDLGARVKYAPTAEESPGEILAMLYDPDGNIIGLIGSP